MLKSAIMFPKLNKLKLNKLNKLLSKPLRNNNKLLLSKPKQQQHSSQRDTTTEPEEQIMFINTKYDFIFSWLV